VRVLHHEPTAGDGCPSPLNPDGGDDPRAPLEGIQAGDAGSPGSPTADIEGRRDGAASSPTNRGRQDLGDDLRLGVVIVDAGSSA